MYVFNGDQILQKHTNISFEYKAREGYYNVVMLKKRKIINLGKHTSPHELYIYKDRERFIARRGSLMCTLLRKKL